MDTISISCSHICTYLSIYIYTMNVLYSYGSCTISNAQYDKYTTAPRPTHTAVPASRHQSYRASSCFVLGKLDVSRLRGNNPRTDCSVDCVSYACVRTYICNTLESRFRLVLSHLLLLNATSSHTRTYISQPLFHALHCQG